MDLFGKIEMEVYEACMKACRDGLKKMLEEADDEIFQSSCREGWLVVRHDDRILVTAGGAIHFKRRYYRSLATGEYCHLLDEVMEIEEREQASPVFREMMLALGIEVPYRTTSAFLKRFHFAEACHEQIRQKMIKEGTLIARGTC